MPGKLLGIVLVQVLLYATKVYGDCALEIGITPAFGTCLKYYTAFQAEMSEEGLLKQGVIIPLLCSDNSKKAIKCMMEYYFQCPQVISNKGNSRKLLKEFETTCLPECTTELGSTPTFRINIAKYKVLEKAISDNSAQYEDEVCSDDNIQTMVSLAYFLYECPTLQMYIGGSNTAQELSKIMFSKCSPETELPSPKPKTCPSALRCVLLLFSNYVQVFFAEVKTPLQQLQQQVGFVCGKTDNAFKECLRESLPESGSCELSVPESTSTLSHVFSMADSRNQSINGYLEKECSAFPDDFAVNTCLQESLESAAFVLCLNGLETNFTSAEAKNECEFHQSSLNCLRNHVTKVCGAHYLPAFQRAMRIFMTNVRLQDCFAEDIETPAIGPSSTASLLQVNAMHLSIIFTCELIVLFFISLQ